jgi:beta-glucanase (GH16 family)
MATTATTTTEIEAGRGPASPESSLEKPFPLLGVRILSRWRSRRLAWAVLIGAVFAGTAQAAPATLDCATVGPLAFDEPFDRLRLWDGRSGWRTDYGYAGPHGLSSFTSPSNGERQIYVAPGFEGAGTRDLGLNPFSVQGGVLSIAARRAPPGVGAAIWNYPYVSGLLSTRDWFSQAYGCFEMRARLPAGKGLWPAFWLLNQDGHWPPELDILEQLGRDPKTIFVTAHSQATGKQTHDGAPSVVADTSAGFHTYAALWTPREIAWYFDGRRVYAAPTPSDMHAPMYVLINLAVGGSWGGDPDATTPLPGRMLVDHVRVYRLSAARP